MLRPIETICSETYVAIYGDLQMSGLLSAVVKVGELKLGGWRFGADPNDLQRLGHKSI